MRFSPLIPKLPHFRPLATVAVLFGQVMLAFGLPSFPLNAFSISHTKDHSTPHPCIDRPCGCMTAEQCWAGACCCFTMRQKIAWAAEHDFVPPEHAVRIAEEEAVTEESDCPHCKADKAKKAKAALANRSSAKLWTVTQFASDCQGKGMIGAFSTQPSLPIESTTAYSLDRPFTGVLPTVETIIFPIFEEISVPPPK